MKVPPLPFSREEIKQELNGMRYPFRVAIDRAKNGFNIGAIIRTAHSFLVKEILLVGHDSWYERAAMGMQRYENLKEIGTPGELVDFAEKSAAPLVAFEKDAARAHLWEADIPKNAILVFGNEDDGVAPEILEASQEVVGIPMYGINHSYPITVAAGIAMAEWARRYGPESKSLQSTKQK